VPLARFGGNQESQKIQQLRNFPGNGNLHAGILQLMQFA
jgi:hypothetical protein